jgi:two-component system OmpR family sensor kinase
MFIEMLNSSHNVVTGSTGLEECPAFLPGRQVYSPKLPAEFSGFTTSSSDPGEETTYFVAASTRAGGPLFRVRASKLANGNVLVLASPLAGVGSTLSQLVIVELLVTAGALAAAIVLGLWLVRVGLRPLRDVERTAEAIAASDLMHRVPNANTRTEVGHLANAFNVMLERVQVLVVDLRASESTLRRFVSDASHELRTPIAAVSAYAQLFKEGAASRSEDLERVMSGIERESARMSRLVNDLLTLAKFDEHRVAELEPVEIVGLVLEAVETARLVGPEWPVAVVADEPVEVLGDGGALRQVVDNLLANVRAHTPVGTRTTVVVRRIGQRAQLEVADEGPGMSEGEAQLVFERFFRVDPSRSRATGGAGLGLAIVASIVTALGGQVEAMPRPGGGALFRVELLALDPEPQSPSDN